MSFPSQTDRLPAISLSRRLLDYLLVLVALGAGGYAVWQLRQPWAKSADPNWLWWLLIGSGLLGGYALVRMEAWLPEASPPARPAAFPGMSQRGWGLLALLAAVLLTAWVVIRLWPDYRQWHGTVLPWLLALALLVVGAGLLRAIGRPGNDYGPGLHRVAHRLLALPPWVELGAFLLILALACFLRLYRLHTVPAGIYVDETNGALDALYILERRGDSPFGTGWYETPNGYIYYMAALFKLFGANYLSLKAASLIPAILTVPAVYLLGRQLFGPVAGLSAMLFMAVSRWHLTMSRWGWNETAPPLFQVLATFFLIRGLRERRALDYTVGGFLTGLVLYTYLSSRLAIATIGLFGLYWLLTDPEGPIASWKRHWRGIFLFTLAATLVAAPIGVTYITHPFTFFNRVNEISIFNEVEAKGSYQPLLDNIEDHLKFFHQSGDRQGKHNLPGEPETDPITGLLFVIGLGYGLLHLRDRRRGLLWFWLLLAMVGGIFSVRHESPQAYRTLNAVPAIALLAGDVLARLASGLVWLKLPAPEEIEEEGESSPGSGRPFSHLALGLSALLVVSALGAAAAWEGSVYFGRQAESSAVQAGFNLMENWATRDVLDALRADIPVYLSPRFYSFSPLRFLVYGVMKERSGVNTLNNPPYRLIQPEFDLPVPEHGSDALFLLDTTYWPLMDYFRLFYPHAAIELVRGPDNAPLFIRARVSREELAAIQGLTVYVHRGDGSVETRRVAQLGVIADNPEAGVAQSNSPITTIEWQGSIRLARSGLYDFAVQGDLTVVLDGETWQGARYLGRGLHRFQVTQVDVTAEEPQVLWQTPQTSSFAPIPEETLFALAPPNQGLTGVYYANENWSGSPIMRQITPFLLLAWPPNEPVPHPFSARFNGQLRIDTAGPYYFRIDADDGVRLILDGDVLGSGLVPDQPNRVEATVQLAAGQHDLQIDYFQRGGGSALEFFWRPPNGTETPVPPDVLTPAP